MADGNHEPKTVATPEHGRWRGWNVVQRRKVPVMVISGLLLAVGLFLLWPSLQSIANKAYGVMLQRVHGSCSGDRDLIRKYNETVRKSGLTGLTEIQKTVQSKPSYKSDPTCMYIVTMSQFGQGDTVQVQKSFETLKKLKSEHKEPVSTINDGLDRKNIYGLIQTLINDSKKGYYGQG